MTRSQPLNEYSAAGDLDAELKRRRKELFQELEIQEAFLKFMAMTLKGYRSHLLPITKAPTVGTTDPQALFELAEFIKSRDKNYYKFFQFLMRTQMFIRFIEERSFVTDGDQGLTFFDECIERLGHDDVDCKLLETDLVHTNDRTVFLLPPEPPPQGIWVSLSVNWQQCFCFQVARTRTASLC